MKNRAEQTNRGGRRPLLSRVAVLSAVLAVSMLSACNKKEEKKAPPPPPPPPPVAALVDVDALMQTVRPDARVQFPAAKAPRSEPLARAVIALADAIAKGDSDAFGKLITEDAKSDLSALTSGGEWEEALKNIEAVRVVRLEGTGEESAPASAIVSLALQDSKGSYVLNWSGVLADGSYIFDGMRSPREVRRRADEWDTGGWDYVAPVAGSGAVPAPVPEAPKPGSAGEGDSGGGGRPGGPEPTK